ncbi:MAG: hypothetical protein D6690_11150 [Nitrospirae bacterium]|nr:MAG: hypothetical protein D6690_11150 [Nitrospirota bacterium]
MLALQEYGYLVRGGVDTSLDCASLGETAFDALEVAFYDGLQPEAEEQMSGPFLEPAREGGRKAFKVANWVGVLSVGGVSIEVLPKTATNRAQGRQLLLNMLRLTQAANFKVFSSHAFAPERMSMYEIFMRIFLDHALHVVKRGLRRDYVECEENRQCFKGRLLVAQNLRLNLGMHHRVYTVADEFIEDRPANRLLKKAIEHVRRKSIQMDSQRLAQELLFAFKEVPASRNVDADFRRLRLDRTMQHYRPALTWAKWLLKGLSPFDREGETEAPSLLFPMQRLFEEYVGGLLREVKVVGSLDLQPSKYYLINNPESFRLRPDFQFCFKGSLCIGDAKWKQLDQEAPNSRFGISQADLYQLYAYGHKYLKGNGRLFLFYPETESFCQWQDLCYEEGLQLSLIPVPLPDSEEVNLGSLAGKLQNRMLSAVGDRADVTCSK